LRKDSRQHANKGKATNEGGDNSNCHANEVGGKKSYNNTDCCCNKVVGVNKVCKYEYR
jgi:hypothetical protein